ncbi:molybdopterin-dependent oxidoreductase [Acetobacterium woodii]|uniref:NADH:quinone oxidoreductase subunit G n=1 Tax=Acetobacterium woodii (strain ATCC 29683 / DSM 1030 / JCM 2381 / KCTC 1655 / WB1) TaxID=931626 RepID=H6LBG1_ACEWD|nr:molybdopterin-dependent oxidoreductase [Acetobacterium woodii]AFA48916.1 NADH:quinone oxidoreductase subunit G [Acetobacterium woodii DSM 1030]
MKKYNINIDGKEVTGYPGQTILAVARENKIDIPTLCYDERLEIYGSCGLCVVEVQGIPKILKACATEITPNMIVNTRTPRVIESRKTNLELLLSKHIGDCVAPCKRACPGTTDCQGYVGLIANGEFEEALKLIKEQLPLPGAIGRVCPHPCETACRRGEVDEPISIAWLKRFAADFDMTHDMFMPKIAKATGKSVGIIGGGPGGLTAAYYLIQSGHAVTIYDAMPKMGGMLRYGIPEYRLPKGIVDEEVGLIEAMGVSFKNNLRIGKDISLETIRKSHDAVFIALGAWTSSGLRCEGIDAKGVIGGIELLRQVANNEPIVLGEKVAIVGGGNTAMDACRSALRLGAKEVYNIYRRTKAEMPAEEIEIIEAEEEGVIFKNLANPIEVIKGENGEIVKIRLQKMALGEPDASGRRSPIPIDGEEEIIDIDTLVLAIGQGINASGFDDLELTKWKTVLADEKTFRTNLEGVFAGGDCINSGASIAIKAIGDAKKAVAFIEAYLNGETIAYHEPYYVIRESVDQDYLEGIKKNKRPVMVHLTPDARNDNFQEVVEGYTPLQAVEEGKRCLECGCQDFFECKLVAYANEYEVKPERFKGKNPEAKIQDDHPFVIRDNSKCITCGLCVRVCDEIVGASALGLVDRGFETIVEPALRQPLAETGCVSCGVCISVCPTGALREGLVGVKQVPMDTTKTESTCGYCSAGCQIIIESKGDTIIKAVPQKNYAELNQGVMCGRGRFGTNLVQWGDRLTTPLIRNKQGVLEEASWYDAFVMIAKKSQSIIARYGNDALKMGISPKYTNEEIYTMTELAKVLRVETFSFSNRDYGEKTVLAGNCAVHDMEAIVTADTILVLGMLAVNNPIIKYKLSQASKNGANILVINHLENGFDQIGDEFITECDDLEFLAEITKYVIENGKLKRDLKNLDGLKESLQHLDICEEAEVIGEGLVKAKNLVVVMGDKYVTAEASALVANILGLLGKTDGFRSGIFRVAVKNNSQGLKALGVVNTASVLKSAKAMLLFGEEPNADLNQYDFLMVQDTHLTDAAAKADVVLPALAFPEVNGTFVNTEGRLCKVKKAVDNPLGMSNVNMVKAIADILSTDLGSACPGKILKAIGAVNQAFKNVDIGAMIETNDGDLCDVNLAPYAEGRLFTEIPYTDYLMNEIQGNLNKVIKH